MVRQHELGGIDAGDRGFATVWVVTAMAIVIAAAGVAISVGAVTLERHRAGAAADAVALAVALRAIDGPSEACAAGTVLGHLDGATVTRCELRGADAEIAVVVRLPGPLAGLGAATASAKAGPVGEADSG
jgi:secretion/DNA translocation related TadE-like protein